MFTFKQFRTTLNTLAAASGLALAFAPAQARKAITPPARSAPVAAVPEATVPAVQPPAPSQAPAPDPFALAGIKALPAVRSMVHRIGLHAEGLRLLIQSGRTAKTASGDRLHHLPAALEPSAVGLPDTARRLYATTRDGVVVALSFGQPPLKRDGNTLRKHRARRARYGARAFRQGGK